MIGNAVQLAGTTCTVSALFKATERYRERSSPAACLEVSGLCLQLANETIETLTPPALTILSSG